jgi:hypothetical protein
MKDGMDLLLRNQTLELTKLPIEKNIVKNK